MAKVIESLRDTEITAIVSDAVTVIVAEILSISEAPRIPKIVINDVEYGASNLSARAKGQLLAFNLEKPSL